MGRDPVVVMRRAESLRRLRDRHAPEMARATCPRQSAAAAAVIRRADEVRAIIRGIEFAAKAHVPARLIAERGTRPEMPLRTASAVASGTSGMERSGSTIQGVTV